MFYFFSSAIRISTAVQYEFLLQGHVTVIDQSQSSIYNRLIIKALIARRYRIVGARRNLIYGGILHVQKSMTQTFILMTVKSLIQSLFDI